MLGFLCSAIMKMTKHLNQMGNALDMTSFVAEWVTRSRAQMRYVRELLRSSISGTRLITYSKY